nr:immunoglobulin light chain junction region [Macaca mulatta]MOY14707.1 immunoglobulin light chain junction region [Macaca mulatta]MOY14854.1 immunoglobulin light chain junction region [Macaca mulatta]MOY14946.1 immunoglobulin light chain junction region [Macaca mulatta]MOY15640.1 immunoglobulin light chain junction region [Macaca mulatta]
DYYCGSYRTGSTYIF